jgi:hypothetical protein
MDSIYRRCFLVGCPRSGTTLLQSMLASHPRIHSFPETHFFCNAVSASRWRRWVGVAAREAPQVLNDFVQKVERSDPTKYIPRAWRFATYARSFRNILDLLTLEDHKDVWVEKTPRHLHYVRYIERYMPRVRFIHIVRDGRDVVASLYEVTHEYPELWGGKRAIDECIARWNSDVKLSLALKDSPNHRLTRYEDLLENPEDLLYSVCDFIGIEYVPAMLKYRETADGLILSSEPWKQRAREAIHDMRHAKFCTLFTPQVQAYIESRLLHLP